MLLRSAWWLSALIGLGVFLVVRLLLDAGFAFFAALPFLVIANVVLWRDIRAPRGARLDASLAKLRAMSWEEFAAALEAGLRREGYSVKRVQGAADFELEKAGRVSLVAAKRWKASRTGVEPLRELAQAGEKRGGAECVFVSASEITENALAFASQKKVRTVVGLELVRLAAGVA